VWRRRKKRTCVLGGDGGRLGVALLLVLPGNEDEGEDALCEWGWDG